MSGPGFDASSDLDESNKKTAENKKIDQERYERLARLNQEFYFQQFDGGRNFFERIDKKDGSLYKMSAPAGPVGPGLSIGPASVASEVLKKFPDGVYRSNPDDETNSFDFKIEKGKITPLSQPRDEAEFLTMYGQMMDLAAIARGATTITIDWDDIKYINGGKLNDVKKLIDMAMERGLMVEFGPNLTNYLNGSEVHLGLTAKPHADGTEPQYEVRKGARLSPAQAQIRRAMVYGWKDTANAYIREKKHDSDDIEVSVQKSGYEKWKKEMDDTDPKKEAAIINGNINPFLQTNPTDVGYGVHYQPYMAKFNPPPPGALSFEDKAKLVVSELSDINTRFAKTDSIVRELEREAKKLENWDKNLANDDRTLELNALTHENRQTRVDLIKSAHRELSDLCLKVNVLKHQIEAEKTRLSRIPPPLSAADQKELDKVNELLTKISAPEKKIKELFDVDPVKINRLTGNNVTYGKLSEAYDIFDDLYTKYFVANPQSNKPTLPPLPSLK